MEEEIKDVKADPLTETFFADAIFALEKLLEVISHD